jgi:hypothetical protein
MFVSQVEANVLNTSAQLLALDSINIRVRALSSRVKKLGSSLSEQQRAGGDSVASLLSDVSGSRKIWITELEQARYQKDSARVRALLIEGRRTVGALDSAAAALGSLIQQLGS